MTQQAADTYGTAFKNGTVTLLARVLGCNGLPVVRADVGAVAYSVYLLDDQDADARAAIAGHEQAALAPGDVVCDALRTDAPWDTAADTLGYNFRHTLDVSLHPAFPIAGRRYLVEYRLASPAGQTVLIRFRINVI
jgi:hypothetical protein